MSRGHSEQDAILARNAHMTLAEHVANGQLRRRRLQWRVVSPFESEVKSHARTEQVDLCDCITYAKESTTHPAAHFTIVLNCQG